MEGIIISIVIGIVAGFLAGLIFKGAGFGLIGDLIIGILGGFVGNWLFGRVLGFHIGGGFVSCIIFSTGGAIVLLWILSLLFGKKKRRR